VTRYIQGSRTKRRRSRIDRVHPLSQPGDRHPELAEVRHDWGRESGKSFIISSGNRQVYTTFAIEFEVLGKAEAGLVQVGFPFGGAWKGRKRKRKEFFYVVGSGFLDT
jgi:hypothetical protein